jgi:hypothetical protein
MVRLLTFLSCLFGAVALLAFAPADSVSEKAHKLHFSSIVVDTHDDTTQRLFEKGFDRAILREASTSPACAKVA